MFEAVEALLAEHAELERRLADPDIHADHAAARRVGRRYAELGQVVQAYNTWRSAGDDLVAARELASEDPAFAEEAERLAASVTAAEERLRTLLIPRDPNDDKNVILEVKAGAGGEESALFAGDLWRMYERYAEQRRWKTEVLDLTESELGGIKSITIGLKVKGSGSASGDDSASADSTPYARLKFEGGVHRVQRVPVTESAGRIHTSAAGVLVLPEAEEIDVEVDEKDLRIDAFRSSGPGGQSVNTTDSAVRITHEPSGIVVSSQNEKSQLQNREQAMRVLRSRLLLAAQEAAEAEAAEARRSQIRTVDRSERVRTYNFPENRISDHRIGYTAYNLSHVLRGELDGVINALLAADHEQRLASLEGSDST